VFGKTQSVLLTLWTSCYHGNDLSMHTQHFMDQETPATLNRAEG